MDNATPTGDLIRSIAQRMSDGMKRARGAGTAAEFQDAVCAVRSFCLVRGRCTGETQHQEERERTEGREVHPNDGGGATTFGLFMLSPAQLTRECTSLLDRVAGGSEGIRFASDIMAAWFGLTGYFHVQNESSAPWHLSRTADEMKKMSGESPPHYAIPDAFFFREMFCPTCPVCQTMKISDSSIENIINAALVAWLPAIAAVQAAVSCSYDGTAEFGAKAHAFPGGAPGCAVQFVEANNDNKSPTPALSVSGSCCSAETVSLDDCRPDSTDVEIQNSSFFLSDQHDVSTITEMSTEEIMAAVFDETQSDGDRTAALEALSGPELEESVGRLTSLAQVTQTSLSRRFLAKICRSQNLPHTLRYSAIRGLYSSDVNAIGCDDVDDFSATMGVRKRFRALLAQLLVDICSCEPGDYSPLFLFGIAKDIFSATMPSEDGGNMTDGDLGDLRVAEKAVVIYVTTTELASESIYRAVLGLCSHCSSQPWLRACYDRILSTVAGSRKNINVRYRILASQHILSGTFPDHEVDSDTRRCIEESLITIAENRVFPKRVRADAADVLITNSPQGEEATRAEAVISELGLEGGSGMAADIYGDAQNVHRILGGNDNSSFAEIVSYLRKWHRPVRWSFAKVTEFCLVGVPPGAENDAIRGSLARIEIDRQIHHPKLRVTDMELLRLLVCYITRQAERDEETAARLREELMDAQGWCSTGYITRLANVMSGREGLQLRIPLADAMYVKLRERVSQVLRDCHEDPSNPVAEKNLCDFSNRLTRDERARIWSMAYGHEDGTSNSDDDKLRHRHNREPPMWLPSALLRSPEENGLSSEIVSSICAEWGPGTVTNQSPVSVAFLFALRSVGTRAFAEFMSEDPSHRRNLSAILAVFATTFTESLQSEFQTDPDFAGSLRAAFARIGL